MICNVRSSSKNKIKKKTGMHTMELMKGAGANHKIGQNIYIFLCPGM